MPRPEPRSRRFRAVSAAVLVLACLLLGVSAAEAELLFKRADGPAIPFTGTPRAWCGPWGQDSSRPSVHVELANGRRHWELRGVRRDIVPGRRISFPSYFVFDRPRRVQLFVAAPPGIEASTAEEEGSGSMVFTRLGCGLGETGEFRIHAVLGSELSDGERVRVGGTYSGQVSEPPSIIPARP